MDDACFDLDFGNRRCSDENILDSGTKMVVNIFVYYHGMVGSHCFRSIAESSFLGWGGAASGRRSGLYSWRYYIWIEKPNLALAGFGFHEIFHIFVMIGSACHIAFMFLYVL